MVDITAIITVTVVFATIFGVIFMFLTTRNRERMALIEKGADANLFRSKRSAANSLKYGMVAVGVGLGIFVGYILEVYAGMEAPIPYFAMIALFGGSGLILFYLNRKKEGLHNEG